MFGSFKQECVESLLAEGRSWADRLSAAAEATEEEAAELSRQAEGLRLDAAATQFIADEGKAVADNFKKILYPS